MNKKVSDEELQKIISSLKGWDSEDLSKLGNMITKMLGASEHFVWGVQWKIKKYFEDEFCENAVPYETVSFAENLTTDKGIEMLLKLLIGSSESGVTAFNNANSRIYIGSSTQAESVADTGVVSSLGNVAMSAGFPKVDGRTVTFEGVAGSTECLGNWNEASVTNGTNSSSVALNRKVQTMGTKVSGVVWTIQVAISALSS